MVRLRRIEPSGFRGARLPVALDFGDDCKSAVVYGANGHGKSSFVDALEWYLGNTIEHLQRENVGRAAYRHRAQAAGDVAAVRVEFSDADLNGSLEIDASRQVTLSADSDRTGPFREVAADELVILRHKDLARFVDMTKGEKLQALAPLIGLEVLSDVHAELARALGQLEQDANEQTRSLEARRRSIERTLSETSFSTEQVWPAVTALLAEAGVNGSVSTVAQLEGILSEVTVAADPERDRQLKTLRAAKDAVAEFADLPEAFGTVEAFASAFDALAKDQKALRELQLVELWEAGQRVVDADWWEGELCPLCGRGTDTHELDERINHQLQAAAETQRRCTDMEGLRRACRRDLEAVESVLQRVAAATKEVEQTAQVCEAGGELLVIVAELLASSRQPLMVDTSLPIEPLERWRAVISAAKEERTKSLEALTTRIDELSPSDQERTRLEAYRRLSALESDLRELEQLEKTDSAIRVQVNSMRRVLKRFEDHERASVAEVLERVSGNVTRYYRKLHGGERYDDVRLEFLPDDRGLEFRLEAYGEAISPPRLMLSESHLNSLGLCLFLAAAREFNSESRFLVLDDVVNSFDAEHRAQLASLLVEEFDDFQIVAFTHDPIWFDILRRIAPRWVVRKIAGWSFELGILIVGDPAEERARIEEFLGQGEEEIAGNLTRQLAEQRLKRLCQELRVLVPYREGYENERRTAHELFRALRRHMKPRQSFKNNDNPVWDQFEASNFLANLASHDQPEMATALSASDLRFALDRLEELEAIFRCDSCNKWAWKLRSDPGDDHSQCGCGELKV